LSAIGAYLGSDFRRDHTRLDVIDVTHQSDNVGIAHRGGFRDQRGGRQRDAEVASARGVGDAILQRPQGIAQPRIDDE
jgi:hypothetical protein